MQKLIGRARIYRHGYVLYRVELHVDYQTLQELQGKYVKLHIADLNITIEKAKVHRQKGLHRIFILIPYEVARNLQIKTPAEVTVEAEVL